MKKPIQHEIDSKAKNYLDSLFPSWVINEFDNDYGKDYLIETTDHDRQLTGLTFYAQLKGTKRITQNRKGITFTLDTKHIKYYIDKVKDLPIFLIVVDVTTKRGWWIFLQRFFSGAKFTSKNKTIVIPKTNTFDDVNKFNDELETANQYMRGSHPKALPSILAVENQRINDLDPRFTVRSVSTNKKGESNIEISPKEPVKLSLTFNTPDENSRNKLNDFINTGKSTHFSSQNLIVDGSPLFEAIPTDNFLLQIESQGYLECDIATIKNDKTTSIWSGLHANFKGLTYRNLAFDDTSLPLTMKLQLSDDLKSGNCTYSFNFTKWNGHPILQLPWFDMVKSLISGIASSGLLDITLKHQGQRTASYKCSPGNIALIPRLHDFLEIISKARSIAVAHEINPIWSIEKFKEDLSTIEMMYLLSCFGDTERSMPGINLGFSVDKNMKWKNKSKKTPQKINFQSEKLIYALLEKEIYFKNINYSYSHLLLVQDIYDAGNDDRKMSFKGSKKNKLVMHSERGER